jgi:hypothetical protein
MRFTLWLTLLAGIAGMTGCAPAVAIHPLYTTQDLVSDLPLEGAWTSNDGEIWRIQRSGDGYDVAAVHAGDSIGVSNPIRRSALRATCLARSAWQATNCTSPRSMRPGWST